eukprot:jgi/Mesvir1/8524/Mv01115-RA.1
MVPALRGRREPARPVRESVDGAEPRPEMAAHLAECLNGKTRDGLVEVEELFRGVLAVAAPETFLLALGRMEGRPERAKVVFVHASDGRAIGGADLLQMACIAAPQGAQVVDVHGDHFAADTILVPTAYMHVVRLIKDRLKLGWGDTVE